jgi:tRNA pseudouridine38-40 synthase
MVRNFKILIEYDGTGYHGWQRQKDDPTIQGEIERALMTMTAKKITVTGSGRTDAGVHAFGQVANFHCDTDLVPEAFHRGLNSLLPKDIIIRECRQVDEGFHARYDVKSKTYRYAVLNRPTPAAIGRQYAWFIRRPLHIHAMRAGIAYIIGRKDFSAFEGAGSPRAHPIRNVFAADLSAADNGQVIFSIEADGFLRFMVRNIVGTLIDVGLDKTSPEDFGRILSSKDRRNAGATAPAHGLFLMEVKY